MKLTIYYGTESGNCEALAGKVEAKAEKLGHEAEVINLAETTPDTFTEVDNPFVVIISTWDDGAPPPACEDFMADFMESDFDLSGKMYAVLALGDTNYPLFCECGKQFDTKLKELGATALMDRTDLSLDFDVGYIGWSRKFWKALEEATAAMS